MICFDVLDYATCKSLAGGCDDHAYCDYSSSEGYYCGCYYGYYGEPPIEECVGEIIINYSKYYHGITQSTCFKPLLSR